MLLYSVVILAGFLNLKGVGGCARTSSVGTTTVATVTTAETTVAGATTTVATTVAGDMTTTSSTTTTTTTTTTTENKALTCKASDVTLQTDPGIPGSIPTAGPIVVANNANTMTITCVAMTTTMTQISFNNGDITLAPATMDTQTLTCNAMGQWTFGQDPNIVIVMTAACEDI